MIFITQLIYVEEGKESLFHEFEDQVIPLLSKHGGQLMLRLRPDEASFLSAEIERPYEMHVLSFSAEADFDAYLNDEERSQYLDMRDRAIRASFLIKGERI